MLIETWNFYITRVAHAGHFELPAHVAVAISGTHKSSFDLIPLQIIQGDRLLSWRTGKYVEYNTNNVYRFICDWYILTT